MSTDEREFLQEHFERQDKMLEEIHRAMYGEPKNEVPGVLSRLKMVELKVKKIFNERSKVIWVGGTAIAIVTGIVELIKFFYN